VEIVPFRSPSGLKSHEGFHAGSQAFVLYLSPRGLSGDETETRPFISQHGDVPSDSKGTTLP